VIRFFHGEINDYPPFPEHYFDADVQQIFTDYELHVRKARQLRQTLVEFPEAEVLEHIDNTWSDTSKAVFNNWLGKVYQLTNQDRRLPFMEGINPDDPLDFLR
jgi:homoserine O-succinyltransferase